LREAYFIQSGVVTYIAAVAAEEECAAGVVGDEGVVGIPSFLRYHRAIFRVIVQIKGEALRIDGEVLQRECDKGGELPHIILCHAHAVVSQFAQAIVCNRLHIVEKRLARFLLMVHDRVRSSLHKIERQSRSPQNGRTRRTGCKKQHVASAAISQFTSVADLRRDR
jgi:hypothetical protein